MRPLGRKDLRSVQHQHLAHALRAFPPAENKNAGCNAGTVEKPLAQGDNGLDQVAFDKLLTNLTLGIATEKNALRQDDGDTSVQGILARAGQAVRDEDLADAVSILKELKGTPAFIMREWVASAKRYIEVKKTIDETVSAVLSVLNTERLKGERS